MAQSTRRSNSLLTASVLILVAATTVSAQNPICYLCGGDPDATFLLPDELIPDTTTTCDQLFMFGLNGLIPETDCAQASVLVELQELCGCSNLEGTPTAPTVTTAPSPAALESDVPSTVPSDAPSSIFSTTPSDVPSAIISTAPSIMTPIALETQLPGGSDEPSASPSAPPKKCKKGKKGMMMKGEKEKGGMGKGKSKGKVKGDVEEEECEEEVEKGKGMGMGKKEPKSKESKGSGKSESSDDDEEEAEEEETDDTESESDDGSSEPTERAVLKDKTAVKEEKKMTKAKKSSLRYYD